jgi:hypothetical protein
VGRGVIDRRCDLLAGPAGLTVVDTLNIRCVSGTY